jgi:ribonuclease G
MLKDDSYFNKNIRLGEDIVVQIIKEEISKKGPTVTQKIFFEDEKIKVYPYNKNDSIFERKFNFSQRQYLQIVTKLIKPKDSSIEFKEKDNKINIWEMVRRLKGLEKQSLIIERKIKNVLHSSCLKRCSNNY